MKTAIMKPRVYAFLLCAILIAGLAVRIGYGLAKTEFHVDEAITLGLTNETWMPFVDTGFMGKWLEKRSLEEKVFNDNIERIGHIDYSGISNSTALDVHPPLFYWLYAGFRLLFGVNHYMAAGLALNCLCFLLSCFFFVLVMKRVADKPFVILISLALFALSSATVSQTIFLRMYELLQMLCLFFLACAIFVLFPMRGKNDGARRVLALAGLCVSSFLGLLTQYYFLLFVVPVAAVALILLVRKKDFAGLLWSILAVIAGFYLAYRIFPGMEKHLTGSQRSAQSFANLFEMSLSQRFVNIGAYAVILLRYIAPVSIAILSACVSIFIAVTGKDKGSKAPRISGEFYALLIAVSAFTFFIIALSAPYRTLRYVAAFTPVYVMLCVCIVYRLLPEKLARQALCVAFAIGVGCLGPWGLATFHEDYVLDRHPAYMADDKPVIIASTYEGFSWKNMLLYKNIPAGKMVYVTIPIQASNNILTSALSSIAAESGAREVYAFVDDYFETPPKFTKVGYYGFFDVYSVPVE